MEQIRAIQEIVDESNVAAAGTTAPVNRTIDRKARKQESASRLTRDEKRGTSGRKAQSHSKKDTHWSVLVYMAESVRRMKTTA